MVKHRGLQFYGLIAGLALCVSGELWCHPPEHCYFGYHVSDPERYGVVDFYIDRTVKAIVEKPEAPPSNYALTGLYFVDGSTPERAKSVNPSAHGELKITSLH